MQFVYYISTVVSSCIRQSKILVVKLDKQTKKQTR